MTGDYYPPLGACAFNVAKAFVASPKIISDLHFSKRGIAVAKQCFAFSIFLYARSPVIIR